MMIALVTMPVFCKSGRSKEVVLNVDDDWVKVVFRGALNVKVFISSAPSLSVDETSDA